MSKEIFRKWVERYMKMKPAIITVANQKGGVGKTTTVANLAASFAHTGNVVLVIDCDYQANVTSLLCGDEQVKIKEQSITYAVKNELTLEDVVVGTKFKNIDLVPANRELDDLREQLVGQPNQFRLIDFLLNCPRAKSYDMILIDTHPSLDCFFQSAIAASSYFIIPLFPEADSSRGVAHQLQAIEKIKRYLNPNLVFLGCAIVKYDQYNATHQKFEKLIRKCGKENNFSVFKTFIPNSQSVAAAAAHGLPLLHYKSESPATAGYIDLAKEIKRHLNQHSAKTVTRKKTKLQPIHELEIAAEL
jgi:chromosome partitioning protein